MKSSHLLVAIMIAALLSTLVSMYFSGRGKPFRQMFIVSTTIYLALTGILLLRLLGEQDLAVITFLLLISLTTFLLTIKATYKN